MTGPADRIVAWPTPQPPLTCWHYRWGEAFSTFLADAHGLPSLADIAIAPAQRSHAEGRATLGTALARWPGLGIVAVPVGRDRCLLGDRLGETTLVHGVPAELAALAGHLWLVTGRRLGGLEPVCAAGAELVVVCGRRQLGLAHRRTFQPAEHPQ